MSEQRAGRKGESDHENQRRMGRNVRLPAFNSPCQPKGFCELQPRSEASHNITRMRGLRAILIRSRTQYWRSLLHHFLVLITFLAQSEMNSRSHAVTELVSDSAYSRIS